MGEQNGINISVIDVPKNNNPKNKPKKMIDDEKTNENLGNEPKPSYFGMFMAELIGTGLLMFLGCMGCITDFDTPAPIHHMGGIAFGLTVMLIIQIFGHISGAHLNPAVTIATVLFKILKPLMAVVYIVAQFIGATLGYGLLKILAPEEYVSDGFCTTEVHEKITAVQGLAVEIVITTVLILVCCAVWDKRNEAKVDSLPLRFGFIIALLSITAGPLTGASMNTARSFAPLVFGGSWDNHWIYWLGPNLGAFLGCGLYKFLFMLTEDKQQDSKSESVHLDEISASQAEKV